MPPSYEELLRLVEAAEARAEQVQIRAEQAQVRAEKEKLCADLEKIRADQEKAHAEKEKVHAEKEKKRADLERIRADQENARAEKEKAQAEQEKARADLQERREKPSCFVDYVRNTEEILFRTFCIEPAVTAVSKTAGSANTTTSVSAKFYPKRLRPWDFHNVQPALFETLATTFGDEPLFPALTDVVGVGRDMGPGPADEQDLRSFIRTAIEKPAARVVTDLGLGEPSQADVPDRWCVGYNHDGSLVHVLVGEYKAAHKLPAQKLCTVLSRPPKEDFFIQAVRQMGKTSSTESSTVAAPLPANVSRTAPTINEEQELETEDIFVARVICQAYHYMIASGLEFGYVASGDGFIFLRVLEDDPQTLYYFWSVFPVSSVPEQITHQGNDDAGNLAVIFRKPHQTALVYLASLCMLAVKSVIRPMSWIDAREKDLKRWPAPYDEVVPISTMALLPPALDPPNKDKDSGEDNGRAGSGGKGSRGESTKRPRSSYLSESSHSTHTSDSTKTASTPFTIELPTLPYCTQACLHGLCIGAPLDSRCPNVALHRAARPQQSQQLQQEGHPLTAAEVRGRIVAQLAQNMDKDCECLEKWGFFGAYGVLFKLAVIGYGYTFVAKGVQAPHRHVLEGEADVYTAMAAYQGRLLPVFLGLVDLERPLPLHSLARVPHLMLLSYAGPPLPHDMDWEPEANRTTAELRAAGLCNEDVRPANLAWNKEAGRMMQLDFDQASVQLPKRQALLRSPLLAKRELNAAHDDGGERGELPAVKRVRYGRIMG
ncbi:hypothetical protein CMQ_6357 [Grosmannia clavigera kw1407]|uniref:Metalloprotease m41 n=1 Tax=Grosmannia clavigera (strain kw1407 / UAMH 11150) TaxID=655863 RepID=F0XLI6_GROCL|nr:uncharacterized protein CMQ_6357 [Grosmannia clavigera kw1407]EFX01415.1 hypothetical protein CMQ_6357 [Grosmannia clavigera kw1407]